jgi:hypothetical protein
MGTLWIWVLLFCVLAIFVGGIMTILRGILKMRELLRKQPKKER